MKALLIAAITAIILSSCPYGSIRTFDVFYGKDKEMPELLSYELVDNSSMRLVYSEDVFLVDINLDGESLDYELHGTLFSIPLQRELNRGETARFSVTAEDEAGNTARASIEIVGKNLKIPEAVINEVSIKGTSESPDRIEILFLEAGSSAGMVITDGLPGEEKHRYILPDIEVMEDDLILIYWDHESESYDPIFDNGRTGYILFADSPETLSGTNGALLLYDELDGEIADGIIYTTGESELSEGYGNNRTMNAAKMLQRLGEWEGEPISSVPVTSSRVIARLPGGQDTNSAADFFITEARKSTFGKINQYLPYTEG